MPFFFGLLKGKFTYYTYLTSVLFVLNQVKFLFKYLTF